MGVQSYLFHVAAVVLLILAFCGCARPGQVKQQRRSPEQGGRAWTYEVRALAEAMDSTELQIQASFAPSAQTSLTTDEDAAPFVRDVERWTRTGWQGVPQKGTSWLAACDGSECRVRYRFELGLAAREIGQVDTALSVGGLLIAPPSTWLLRPAEGSEVGKLLARVVTSPARVRFATGLAPASAPFPPLVESERTADTLNVQAAADTFEASTSEIDAASFAVFGAFRPRVVRNGLARIDLVIAPEGLGLKDDEVAHWIQTAVNGIADYYGQFPTRRTLVIVVPGQAGETEGETLGDGGPSVAISAGRGLTAAAVRDDWVVTHELLHVTLPSLPRHDAWLSEGLATYVEPLVRARAGLVSTQQYWRELVRGIPQGLPEAGDEGLEVTHTWGRTYWGGALFCLLADVRIRERTHGERSLDDALRGIVATGANVTSHWFVEHFLEVGDKATGTSVLADLYREMAFTPVHTDLAVLWKSLGVIPEGRDVSFDDRAPLASVRRAMLREDRRTPSRKD